MKSLDFAGALAPSKLLLHVLVLVAVASLHDLWSTCTSTGSSGGLINYVDAFQPSCPLTLSVHVPNAFNAMSLIQSNGRRVELYAQLDEEDGVSDDEEYIDDSLLDDWRAFRANLANSGMPTQSEDRMSDKSSGGAGSSDDSPVASSRPKSVSKRNEKLLKSQNAELYKEYESGVWAHEAPAPEVGGLLCRLPLEAEIYRNAKYCQVGRKLQDILERNDEDSTAAQTPSQSDDGLGSSPGVSFSLLGAKTLYWYRKARALIDDETNKVTAGAVGGEIDASTLSKESIDFLNLYLNHQDTWQEVCLVVERKENGAGATLVLNRPMAFTLSDSIARLVLFGAYRNDLSPEELELLVKFSIAFDKEIYCYLGGPDELEKSAYILHGIAGLEGSKEIAPNTGIFMGQGAAIEAAVTLIMQGMYSPSDFRFFVGKHSYLDGRLDLECVLGKYQPIACSRAVALKQCKALPKPLFHEVMELCGGELAELSKLELMKRDDVQLESVDDE